MTSHLFTAIDIATILAAPGEPPLIPTTEQQAVIESPPEGAVLVVAGAGSGKTETIANRVIWLVANGVVDPGEVLGLTFTRKAAGELAERVRGRLLTFIERGRERILSAPQSARILQLDEHLTTELNLPEVSTYNGFASALVQEFGAANGRGELIDEAVSWSIAREVVTESTDPRLAPLNLSVETLIAHTLKMARDVNDHLSSFDAAREELTRFSAVLALPYDEKALAQAAPVHRTYASLEKQVQDFDTTLVVIDLAEQYTQRKRELGVLEFSDQVLLAREALTTSPEALSVLRQRHRVVLLDEVQDTSVAQTTLLSQVFAGEHVMAVGDPHQSIYGWRGASTESLSGFHRAFQSTSAEADVTLSLSTSWRNDRAILTAANRVALPLQRKSLVPVATLVPSQHALEGSVEAKYSETLEQEILEVAAWCEAKRTEFAELRQGTLPTAAIILRKRKYMPRFAEALRERGIPARIVGVGGLLETPEVRDLASALRCTWYADASNELIRVLAGPRFALGAADIAGLADCANWFAQRDFRHREIDGASLNPGVLETLDRPVTLVDALDALLGLPEDHQSLSTISPLGVERLRDAARMFRELRSLTRGDVYDVVRAATIALHLDIELEAHDRYADVSSASARENLQSFTDAIHGFLQVSEDRSLPAVLDWLELSARDDTLPAYMPPPEPGTVQLITVHSAKGLEWDLVAIPRQSAGEFPSKPRSSRGELAAGTIPDACRGDAASRPVAAWKNAETQQQVRNALAEYQQEQAALLAEEELRLIYVAYTRAKHALLLTGAFWSGLVKPLAPAAPLRALAGEIDGAYEAVCRPGEHFEPLIEALPEESASAEEVQHRPPHTLEWPLDALGARRLRVERAAHAVQHAAEPETPDALAALFIADELEQTHSGEDIPAFDRVNASAFHEFVADPRTQLTQAVRPVPQRPFRRTRIGNLFHEWVERRSGTPRGTELSLSDPDFFEPGVTETEQRELRTLIANFELSRWATAQPVMIEEQLTIPFAGRRMVCKLDAVYQTPTGYEIVDWKTGRSPQSSEETSERLLQLDLYRAALALHLGIDPATIEATLFYVEEAVELRSERGRSLAELEALWRDAYVSLQGGDNAG